MRTFTDILEAVAGMTPGDVDSEFNRSALYGFPISDLSEDEQRGAFALTLRILHKTQRELHEMRLADIPRQVEAMRPKASRITRAMRALFDY